jgi:hypothetical protein
MNPDPLFQTEYDYEYCNKRVFAPALRVLGADGSLSCKEQVTVSSDDLGENKLQAVTPDWTILDAEGNCILPIEVKAAHSLQVGLSKNQRQNITLQDVVTALHRFNATNSARSSYSSLDQILTQMVAYGRPIGVLLYGIHLIVLVLSAGNELQGHDKGVRAFKLTGVVLEQRRAHPTVYEILRTLMFTAQAALK